MGPYRDPQYEDPKNGWDDLMAGIGAFIILFLSLCAMFLIYYGLDYLFHKLFS